MGGQHDAPAALPLGKTRYPLYRRLGGPQSRSGRVQKNLGPHRDSIPVPSSPQRVALRYSGRLPTAIPSLIHSSATRFLSSAKSIQPWSPPKLPANSCLVVLSPLVRRPGRKTDDSLRCSAQAKIARIYRSPLFSHTVQVH